MVKLKLVIFSLIPLTLLLITGEILSRVKLFLTYKEFAYLTTPLFSFPKKVINYKTNVRHPLQNTPGYFKMQPGAYPKNEFLVPGYYTINSLGFRGKEFNPFNKEGKIRIMCVGESSTIGLESDDADTWPAKLQYYLDTKNMHKYEVINCGFASSSSLNHLNLIRHELLNYKPDIIIIYSASNDVTYVKERKVNPVLAYIHNCLYYKSMLYTLLLEKWGFMQKKNPPPLNRYELINSANNYRKNTEEIINICKKNNIELIFVRQMIYAHSDFFTKDTLSIDDMKRIEIKKPEYTLNKAWLEHANWKFYYQFELIKQLKELCLRYNIKLLDFRNEFYDSILNGKRPFYDYIHLTADGNDLLAKLISENILSE